MKRGIKAFNQDENGDWVAELVCGHMQHVRHDPPWQERPWVLQPEERQKMIGVELECGLCDSKKDVSK